MDNGESFYRRFLEGDESAFDGILALYFDNLTFFINRYVHDMAAAEDLAIDSLLQLIVHPHRYHFKTPLKTYLFAIGRNRAINYLKRRNRTELFAPSDTEKLADRLSLEEEVLSDERKLALSAALDTLPKDMRAAVHLVYFENMSYEEAARIMKKNRKQVDNLLYRAKAALRSVIGEEGMKLL